MKNLTQKLKELQERDFTVVVSRGTLALQQTERNKAKAEIVDAIYKDLKETLEPQGFQIYETADGPVIELLNPNVDKKVVRMAKESEEDIYTGFISIQLDAVMKNLDTNALYDEIDYRAVLAEKQRREEEKLKRQESKKQKDAEIRAEKARRREEEIMRLAALQQKMDEEK